LVRRVARDREGCRTMKELVGNEQVKEEKRWST
jgi:hypothetical protein